MDNINPNQLITTDFDWLSPDLTLIPSSSAFLSHTGNADLMNTLFLEQIVPNIATVIEDADDDTLDNGDGEGGNHSDSDGSETALPVQSLDEDNIAITFAAQHRAPFARTLSDAGLSNWALLCDVMLIKFFSDAGTQTSRPFFGWREDAYIEFITNMFDALMRRGVTDFEHREILIEIKLKNGAVKIVKAYSTLTDSNFMEAVQRMLYEEFPRNLIAYWGCVASALTNYVLPATTPDRLDIALEWTRRTIIQGVYSYPFLHEKSNEVVNCYSRPEFLTALHVALIRPYTDTFAGIFSTKVSADGAITFGLLRHSNAHTLSIVAGLVLTGLDLVSQKKNGLLINSWLPGDTKEKKFREIQKYVSEEARVVLACNGDAKKATMEEQVERRNKLLHVLDSI